MWFTNGILVGLLYLIRRIAGQSGKQMIGTLIMAGVMLPSGAYALTETDTAPNSCGSEYPIATLDGVSGDLASTTNYYVGRYDNNKNIFLKFTPTVDGEVTLAEGQHPWGSQMKVKFYVGTTCDSKNIVNSSSYSYSHGPFTFNVVANQPYYVKILKKDKGYMRYALTFSFLQVSGNSAPTSDAGSDQSVNMGGTAQLDGSGSSDLDGDPLTYTWRFISRPAGSSAALSNTAAVNPTFTPDVVGEYVLGLIVNDGTSNSLEDTVTVMVYDLEDESVPTEEAEAVSAVCGSFDDVLQTRNDPSQISQVGGSTAYIYDNPDCSLNTGSIVWGQYQSLSCDGGDANATGSYGNEMTLDYDHEPALATVDSAPSSSTNDVKVTSSLSLTDFEYDEVQIDSGWTVDFTEVRQINSLILSTNDTVSFSAPAPYNLEIGSVTKTEAGTGNTLRTATVPNNIKINTFELPSAATIDFEATQTIKMESMTIGRDDSDITLKAQYVQINSLNQSNSGSSGSSVHIIADYVDITTLDLDQQATITISPYTPGKRILFRADSISASSSSSMIIYSGNYYTNSFDIPGTSDVSSVRAADADQLINFYIDGDFSPGNNPGINSTGNNGNFGTLPAANFLLFVSGNLNTGGGGTTFNCTIYVEGSSTLGSPTYIRGALSSGGDIAINNASEFYYDQSIEDGEVSSSVSTVSSGSSVSFSSVSAINSSSYALSSVSSATSSLTLSSIASNSSVSSVTVSSIGVSSSETLSSSSSSVSSSETFSSSSSSEGIAENRYFFLAPTKHYYVNKMLTGNQLGVSPFGELKKVFNNIFNDESGFSLYYNSDGYRDGYDTMGKFRPSYTATIDKVDYDSVKNKTILYDTRENACTLGFETIKSDIFLGVLENAFARYNEDTMLCDIFKEEKLIARYNVYTTEEETDSSTHYVTTENGNVYVFMQSEEDPECFEMILDEKITLTRNDDETFSLHLIDSTYHFDQDKRLHRVESAEHNISIEYVNDLIQQMTMDGSPLFDFTYNELDKLYVIYEQSNERELYFEYNGTKLNAFGVHFQGIYETLISIENDTANSTRTFTVPMTTIDSLEISPMSAFYRFDSLGRVTELNISKIHTQYFYGDKNTSASVNGSEASTVVYDMVNTTLVPTDMYALTTHTKLSFDESGQLDTITHEEIDAPTLLQDTAFFADVDYNGAGQMTRSDYIDEKGVRQQLFITYDASGKRPLHISTNQGTTVYRYDSDGALLTKAYVSSNIQARDYSIEKIQDDASFRTLFVAESELDDNNFATATDTNQIIEENLTLPDPPNIPVTTQLSSTAVLQAQKIQNNYIAMDNTTTYYADYTDMDKLAFINECFIDSTDSNARQDCINLAGEYGASFQTYASCMDSTIATSLSDTSPIANGTIYYLTTSHRYGPIEAPQNTVYLQKNTYRDGNLSTSDTLETYGEFTTQPSLYAMNYTSADRPAYGHDVMQKYAGTKYQNLTEKALYVGQTLTQLAEAILTDAEAGQCQKYASSYTGTLNNFYNFWTVFCPERLLAERALDTNDSNPAPDPIFNENNYRSCASTAGITYGGILSNFEKSFLTVNRCYMTELKYSVFQYMAYRQPGEVANGCAHLAGLFDPLLGEYGECVTHEILMLIANDYSYLRNNFDEVLDDAFHQCSDAYGIEYLEMVEEIGGLRQLFDQRINARDINTTQVAFVGGGGDDYLPVSHAMIDYYSKPAYGYQDTNRFDAAFYRHYEIGLTSLSFPLNDQFGKHKDNLLVVAHSWGGDAAVSASQLLDKDKGVNVLVTLDPVGFPGPLVSTNPMNIDVHIPAEFSSDGNPEVDYWVNIYADPGAPFAPFGVGITWDQQCINYINLNFQSILYSLKEDAFKYLVDVAAPEINKCLLDPAKCTENVFDPASDLAQNFLNSIGKAWNAGIGVLEDGASSVEDFVHNIFGRSLDEAFINEFCVAYPVFNSDLRTWNESDWIAFSGGKKLEINPFNPANISADITLTFKGHHDEPEKMIMMMQEFPEYYFGLVDENHPFLP